MKKWLILPILAVVLFLGLPNYAAAAETTERNTVVYVSGNPDLFPFEYYDTQSDSYQGILPELYKQISQTAGLEFVYIHPGMINQQNRLAKNAQVELVSAYVRGEIEAAERELMLLRQWQQHFLLKIQYTLGCRQAVRHSTLTAACVGSNPATPAKNPRS